MAPTRAFRLTRHTILHHGGRPRRGHWPQNEHTDDKSPVRQTRVLYESEFGSISEMRQLVAECDVRSNLRIVPVNLNVMQWTLDGQRQF